MSNREKKKKNRENKTKNREEKEKTENKNKKKEEPKLEGWPQMEAEAVAALACASVSKHCLGRVKGSVSSAIYARLNSEENSF